MKTRRLFRSVLLGVLLSLPVKQAQAAEAGVSFTGEPLQYATVKGDKEKFREHHWVREGYDGGVDAFSLDARDLPSDLAASLYVRSVVNANDYNVRADIDKTDFGYFRLRFQEFSRFYDDNGGVFDPFVTLASNTLSRDLELEIGEFFIELGITPPDLPALIFFYERRFRDGSKSRLNWGAVREGGTIRNIAPSWQEIDEIVDVLGLRLEGDVRGFEVSAEQRVEFVEAERMREEKNLSTTAAAADKKIRQQMQDQHARTMTTTLEAAKWSHEDRLFTGGAYRFLHLDNREAEDILELNENGAPTNFTNPKQVRDARGENEYDAHTWTTSMMWMLHPALSLVNKFKSEFVMREGNSLYPQDTTPVAAGGAAPDGVINNTERSNTDNRLHQFGEAVSLRFTGIPRTALYTDLELEQVRNWLSEDRNSLAGQSAPNASEIFSRETLTNIRRGTATAGMRLTPHRYVDVTSTVRYRRNNNDYDDEFETVPTGSTARSAFFDELDITMQEAAARFTFKPVLWARTSFRYQLRAYDYESRIEDQDAVQTDMTAHIFSYEVSVQPVSRLLVMAALTHQQAWVQTPASSNEAAATPRFNFDYTSWFLNGEYQVSERISILSSLAMTLASNYNDFTGIGLPLGADYTELDIGVGFRLMLGEHASLEPRYDFFRYNPDPRTDSSNYNAHMIGLKGSFAWG